MSTYKTLSAKLKAATSVSDVSGKSILVTDGNGNPGKFNPNVMLDGVFIMCHTKSDNYPRMVKPHKWPSMQSGGEVADGVVIVEGGAVLVVAPTECDSAGLLWSSAAMSGGAVSSTDRITAMNDWAGKNNTTQIIAHSTSSAVNNTAAYAPGFCNLYSHGGLGAGKWWLPSAGELMMIFANMTKINYALSLISGATRLAETWYWSSTESGAPGAWLLDLGAGTFTSYTKANNKSGVRPVSAFIS